MSQVGVQKCSGDESPDLALVDQYRDVSSKIHQDTGLDLQHTIGCVNTFDALYDKHGDHDDGHQIHEGVKFECWTKGQLDCEWNRLLEWWGVVNRRIDEWDLVGCYKVTNAFVSRQSLVASCLPIVIVLSQPMDICHFKAKLN